MDKFLHTGREEPPSPRELKLAQRSYERQQGIPIAYSATSPRAFNGLIGPAPRPPPVKYEPAPPIAPPSYPPTVRDMRFEKKKALRLERLGDAVDSNDPFALVRAKYERLHRPSEKRNEELAVRDASEELNKRFSNMRQAFHWVDVDNSGTINRAELERALKLWNVPLAKSRIDQLWAAVDVDKSGEVDYQEFVDALARDTVMPGYSISPPTERPERAQRQESRYLYEEKPPEYSDPERAAELDAVAMAKMGMNTRFADMRKAFHFVDVDNSGTVSRNELERALELWNVPMTAERLDKLWAACDTSGDGEISYAEFVAVLARDTAQEAVTPVGVGHRKSVEEQARDEMIQLAEDGLNSRFSDMHKAFKYVDVDNSGTINRAELERALDLWNIPLSPQKVDMLWAAVDADGSGEVDYQEFVSALARDTVHGDGHDRDARVKKY